MPDSFPAPLLCKTAALNAGNVAAMTRELWEAKSLISGVTETDAAVIVASRVDPELFAAIFDRHAPRIHRYLARRVGSAPADDLLAETFLAAFAQRDRYDPGYPDARPWLYGIATNVLGTHQREEARRLRLLQEAASARLTAPDDSERTVESLAAHAMRPRLAAVLAGLPAADRHVLLLVAWEDLTYEEVARALAIPLGTVRSRLHRARTRARSALAGPPGLVRTDALPLVKETLTSERS